MKKNKNILLIIILFIALIGTLGAGGVLMYELQKEPNEKSTIEFLTDKFNKVTSTITNDNSNTNDTNEPNKNYEDNPNNAPISGNNDFTDPESNSGLDAQNDYWDISIRLYDVETYNNNPQATLNSNPSFVPVTVELNSNKDILFLADEQNIVADVSNPYLETLIEEGASKSTNSSSLYDFSKENFSANNLESFDYDSKMTNSSRTNPVQLSKMAKAKAGYCIEQSIFRSLSYAYADNPQKMVIMYPSQGNDDDFGHATVKSLDATPEEIIQKFLDTGLYTWEVRYFQEIIISKK